MTGGRSRICALALAALALSASATAQPAGAPTPLVWVGDPGRGGPKPQRVAEWLEAGGLVVADATRAGHVTLVDWRSPPGETIDVEREIDRAVAALADRLPGYGPPILVGHRYGGLAAADFARRHPDAVRGVVAVATPFSAGLARRAARLDRALTALTAGLPAGAGEEEIAAAIAASPEADLLRDWRLFVAGEQVAMARVFAGRLSGFVDELVAPFALLRAAWGLDQQILGQMAALEREAAESGDPPAVPLAPVVGLADSSETTLPALGLLARTAAFLAAEPAGPDLPGNGLVAFGNQLPAGHVGTAPIPALTGWALTGADAWTVALPGGEVRVQAPPLPHELSTTGGLRAALEGLGWEDWRPSALDLAVDLDVCAGAEVAEGFGALLEAVAAALPGAGAVQVATCRDDRRALFAGTLDGLGGWLRGEVQQAGSAVEWSPHRSRWRLSWQPGPRPAVALESARSGASGRLELPLTRDHWTATRLLEEIWGATLLEARRAHGVAAEVPLWIDDTIEELLVLAWGGPRTLRQASSGEQELPVVVAAVGASPFALWQLADPHPGEMRLRIEAAAAAPTEMAILGLSPIRASIALAPGGRAGRVELTGAPAGSAGVDARLEGHGGRPWQTRATGGGGFELAATQAAARGVWMLRARIEGWNDAGETYRRLVRHPLESDGAGAAPARPVAWSAPVSPEAEAAAVPERPPAARVAVTKLETWLAYFDDDPWEAALEPYRNRRLVLALEDRPQVFTIGRYFHGTGQLGVLELDRDDALVRGLSGGTRIRLYDQLDYLWNRLYAWPLTGR